jgi:hypothetical protein
MKLFTNWTKDDFSYTFNNVPYVFLANSSTELEDGIADHFALHLANRELNNAGLPTDCPQLQDYINNCFGSYVEPTIETPVPEEPTAEYQEEHKNDTTPYVEKKVVKKVIKKKKVVKKVEKKANF